MEGNKGSGGYKLHKCIMFIQLIEYEIPSAAPAASVPLPKKAEKGRGVTLCLS